MPRSAKTKRASLSASADDVETSFYEALRNRDLQQLMACWAEDEDIVCVFPSGERLVGVAAIAAAFEHLFARSALHIEARRVCQVEGLGSCVHSLLEQVQTTLAEGPRQTWVNATNVYHQTAQGWRLVLHHASPGSAPEPNAQTAQLLH